MYAGEEGGAAMHIESVPRGRDVAPSVYPSKRNGLTPRNPSTAFLG